MNLLVLGGEQGQVTAMVEVGGLALLQEVILEALSQCGGSDFQQEV